MAILEQLADAIINGKRDDAKSLTERALTDKIDAKRILDEGLIKGMGVVGEKFKANEFYVPELLVAARAMHAAMDVLKPIIAQKGIQPVGRAVIGTVRGDLHDIGKNLVAMMLEGAGFQVIDLGVDVAPEKFVEAAKENNAQIIAMSALLTTTMVNMKEVVAALQQAGAKGKHKVMIGGAPITQEYADQIGADGYAPDAASAVDRAIELLPKVTRLPSRHEQCGTGFQPVLPLFWFVGAARLGFEGVAGNGVGARPRAAADLAILAPPALPLQFLRVSKVSEGL
jgi:5-methyltetrahydrofolate--homocysteine methyltransferase